LPGLRYRPAFVVGQTSFAISNALPAGGAIGLGVEYDMLESYGFGAGAAGSASAISSVFNVFATLVMPVVGVLALLFTGQVRWHYLLIAAVGVLVVGAALAATAVTLHSEDGAAGSAAARTGTPTRSPGTSFAAGLSTSRVRSWTSGLPWSRS